jgi:hypothetical protein
MLVENATGTEKFKGHGIFLDSPVPQVSSTALRAYVV